MTSTIGTACRAGNHSQRSPRKPAALADDLRRWDSRIAGSSPSALLDDGTGLQRFGLVTHRFASLVLHAIVEAIALV